MASHSLFPDPTPQTCLPTFASLLVKGPYHPSAPIHICLSHVAQPPTQSRRAIVLSCLPRRPLTTSLQDYNDDWLSVYGAHGRTMDLASRIKIFYPPSPAHLSVLLAMFRIADGPDASLNAKTTLDLPPTLVVLHELSAYFLSSCADADPDAPTSPPPSYTISSYVASVARVLASLTSLTGSLSDGNQSRSAPRFVLFDSRLDELKLPILKTPALPIPNTNAKMEPVSRFVQRYFDWMAIFENVDVDADEVPELRQTKKRMSLYRLPEEVDAEIQWEWVESPGPLRGASEKCGVTFVWG